MVEKWQALESMLRTHTSCPRFCIKNHPEDEMQPKTIMEKNCKEKIKMHSTLFDSLILQLLKLSQAFQIIYYILVTP